VDRLAKKLLQRRRRSAHASPSHLQLVPAASHDSPPQGGPKPARPGLSQQVEKLAQIARELPPLFQRHWEELGHDREAIPLDPDWDRYLALDFQNILRVRTARFDGILAGYIFNLVGPHLHYASTKHAEIEMFWLDPAYRGTSFVLKWFRENDADLKSLGIKRVHAGVKNAYKDGRVGLVFKRLGYKPIETVWGKRL
jgi:hypothetical protein